MALYDIYMTLCPGPFFFWGGGATLVAKGKWKEIDWGLRLDQELKPLTFNRNTMGFQQLSYAKLPILS